MTRTRKPAASSLQINASVESLRRVGPGVAEKLSRLNIVTIQDLLFHLPLRYQDRTRVVAIGSLRHGDEAVIEAQVVLTDVKFGKRRMLLSKISDGTGFLLLRFFHFNASQQQGLQPGTRIRCFGEVRFTQQGLEMVHPEYQLVAGAAEFQQANTPACLTAIYPSTEGLRQFSLRALIDQLVVDSQTLTVDVPEWLPDGVLHQLKFAPLSKAIAYVHKPPPDAPLSQLKQGKHVYQQRLAFEELLAHHLSMRKLRSHYQLHRAPALAASGELAQQLLAGLPFSLTAAQQRVSSEIVRDISSTTPMLRLVQGDVGSGKTIVAALAALRAVEAGYQVAIMAPTELLADQHYHSFQQWFEALGVTVAWLSGTLKGKARLLTLDKLAEGNIQVIVGTHALFQQDVSFQQLGLIIIDEQHRFGVHQRLALRNKARRSDPQSNDDEQWYPHQLIMTATPIPRTLAMTTYADLDCSVIDELPPGRSPVQTVVVEDNRRSEVIARVYQACQDGKQAYWVCTLIEESELLQCQAAENTAQQLTEELPGITVGLVHGRMKPAEKDNVMRRFKQGDIDLLVATTVVEVGVDVPNATLMVIENAERLGLSQLHQLRGRVGRGSEQSSCVLMYHAPLTQFAKARLTVMRDSNDGFEIAQRDLEIRGPGELLGTRQTGLEQFHIADLQRDQSLLPDVISTSNLLLNNYPEQANQIIRRWLGGREQYGNV